MDKISFLDLQRYRDHTCHGRFVRTSSVCLLGHAQKEKKPFTSCRCLYVPSFLRDLQRLNGGWLNFRPPDNSPTSMFEGQGKSVFNHYCLHTPKWVSQRHKSSKKSTPRCIPGHRYVHYLRYFRHQTLVKNIAKES